MYGPTGVVAGIGVGVIHTIHTDNDMNTNMVPADLCINGIIAAAWDISKRFEAYVVKPRNILSNLQVFVLFCIANRLWNLRDLSITFAWPNRIHLLGEIMGVKHLSLG